MKQVLATELGVHASLTTDIWTSEAKDSFISLTLHFLNMDFEQKMVVLGSFPFNESHAAESILETVTEKLNVYEVADKIHRFVRYNAPNMVGAFDISTWNHVGCFLHILQVCIIKI